MRRLMLLCASLWAMALVVPASPAHAQNVSWVSPNGSNSNTCSQTSPCATFAGAISKGGNQINCLGSGNYGALNGAGSITGSIIIDCGDGNVGEMTTGGGSAAININTSSAATIVLRHLSLNGGDNPSTNGINTQAFPGGTLIVENCMIFGFPMSGIYFAPAGASGSRALLQVSDSLLFNNGNNAIFVGPSTGVIASVTLNRDEFTGNGTGVSLGGAGIVAGSMRESVAAESAAYGVIAAAQQVFFTIEESSIIDNLNTGIKSFSSGTVLNVGASTIGGNGTGVNAFFGSIVSFGNNQMSANGTNGTFTSTTPLQ
jgi:hypothetical protein